MKSQFVSIRSGSRFFTNALFSLVAVVLSGGTMSQAQILVNGSFEQPVVTNYVTLFTGATNLAPWVIGTNSDEVVYINNGYPSASAYDGGQYLDLDGGSGPGQIRQTFATTVGRTYYLSFAYANDIGIYTLTGASMSVRIYDTNGTVFGPVTLTHDSSAPNVLNWYFYTNSFTGTGRSNTVEFTSLDPA